jgi:hypothetical protein
MESYESEASLSELLYELGLLTIERRRKIDTIKRLIDTIKQLKDHINELEEKTSKNSGVVQ